MTDSTIPRKQCFHKDRCVNPLGSWLPDTIEYFARSAYPPKLRGVCRECQKARKRELYMESSSKQRDRARAYYYGHREEALEKRRKRREANPEQERAQKRRYEAEHPEKQKARSQKKRAIKYASNGSHSAKDVRAQVRSQRDKRGKLRCWWCNTIINGKAYHVDHRIPLSRGGSNAPENLCITCPTCNLSKNNKMPHEFNGRLL